MKVTLLAGFPEEKKYLNAISRNSAEGHNLVATRYLPLGHYVYSERIGLFAEVYQ
jgi:hypothetical protein